MLFSYLWYQHMIPVCKDSVKPIQEGDYLKVLVNTLKIAVPGAYLWLSMFYAMFHSYMNMWAEITYFADRMILS